MHEENLIPEFKCTMIRTLTAVGRTAERLISMYDTDKPVLNFESQRESLRQQEVHPSLASKGSLKMKVFTVKVHLFFL